MPQVKYWYLSIKRHRSLSVGHYELCRHDITRFRGFTWKPRTSLTKEKTAMKLASGFCIPEPLPMHTGIKGRQVHPLIRFLLRSWVDEKSADLHKAVHLCFAPGWRNGAISSRSPSHQRFPWALQLRKQILKAQITDDRVFFKMPFRPCPSGCADFAVISPFHYERIGTLCRHPCWSLWLEQRIAGWRSGRSEGYCKSLFAGYIPTDLLLLTQRTSRPVPGWFRWSVPRGAQHFIRCAICG